MTAVEMPFPCWWSGGTIATNLDAIWVMSVEINLETGTLRKYAGSHQSAMFIDIFFGHN